MKPHIAMREGAIAGLFVSMCDKGRVFFNLITSGNEKTSGQKTADGLTVNLHSRIGPIQATAGRHYFGGDMNLRALALIFVVLVAGQASRAQQQLDIQRLTGTPNTLYNGTTLEHIDTRNGNLQINIPLLHLPGRGIDTDIVLSYNSKIWQTAIETSPPGVSPATVLVTTLLDQDPNTLGLMPPGTVTKGPRPGASPGWSVGVPRMGYLNQDSIGPFGGPFLATFLSSGGTRIPLAGNPPTSGNFPTTMFSQEGSFSLLNGNSLIYRDGTIAGFNSSTGSPGTPNSSSPTPTAETLTDIDGNVIQCSFTSTYSISGCVDTLGRQITFADAGPVGLPSSMTYLDSEGNSRNVTFQYQTLNLNFSFKDPQDTCTPNVFTVPAVPLLSSVTLANGLTYQFQYVLNPDGSSTGEVSKIIFPTGGYARYVYGFSPDSESSTICHVIDDLAQDRMVVNRFISPDGTAASEQKWTYNITSEVDFVMTVTDPFSAQQTYRFQGFDILAKEIDYIDSSGKVLKSVQGVVQKNLSPSNTLYNSERYQSVTTILPDTNQQSQITYTYTPFDDVVSKDETDWGVGQPGALLRETNSTYEDQINSAYLKAHILGLPASVAVCSPLTAAESAAGVTGNDCPGNGSLKKRAETDNTYDEPSLLTTYPGTLPAGTEVAPPNPVRGHLSTVSRWLNTSSSPAVTHTNWYTTGEPFQQIDALGNSTTHSYSSNFAGAYPTQTCDALNHCVSGNYFLNSGLLSSFTDQNGQTTEYIYDLMSRILQVTWPAQVVNGTAIAGQTSFTYTDSPGSISAKRVDQQDGSNSITTFQFYDGLGRANQTQLNDPEGNVLKKITFDALNRVSTVTNPYRSTSDPTYGTTQTQYDALGRITTVTHPDGATVVTTYSGSAVKVQDEGNGNSRITRISQSDALGRVISVCEVTSAAQANQNAPAACGQAIAGNGFLTAYQYDALNNLTSVVQGGVNRSFTYDSLSRRLSVNNPESGITSYTYDANGNVLTRVRPAPNQASANVTVTTQYAYDKLNRLTNITYLDQTTPSVTKNYDTTLELGIGLDNTVGRLSAEYVKSPTGQLLSGKVFSYDPMGRAINLSQCLPQNCSSSTAFPITYGYDLLGHELSATNGQGVTYNYTYDAAGRLANMTSSLVDSNHPGTLFAGATYNALGALTGSSIGNILSEALAYDCRGRLVSYGSALLPATATAPAVTNSGCPVQVASGHSPRATELLAGLSPSGLLANLRPAQSGAWHGPRFQPNGASAAPEAPKALTETLKGSTSSSILLTRVGKPIPGEKGSVTIRLSFRQTRVGQTVSVAYRGKDNPAKLAKRLRKRINSEHDSLVKAEVSRSGPATTLELVSRERGGSGFLVTVTVDSDQAVPSIRAAASSSSIKQRPPDLLTAAYPGQEVRQ